MIGGFAGHQIDDFFDKTRYPIAVEYMLIDNCISSDERPMRSSYFYKKTEVCISAFSETIKEYDYDKYEKNRNGFMELFEQKANAYIQDK